MSILSFRTACLTLATSAFMLAPLADAGAASPKKQTQEVAFAAQVSDKELGNSRGANSPIIFNSNSLTATSEGNIVIGGVTGNNMISAGSLSNNLGLVNVIQNSGNNVLIQSATSVTVTLQ